MKSSLAIGAKNILNLVHYNILDITASRAQVLARVEVLRMSIHVLADTSSKSQTHIRVNINLADCTLSSLSQLILWDTDSILQVTAVCIDNLNILRYNRGCTMENDWEVWQSLLNLCQNIKPQLWWNQYTISISGALSWGEFESTMAGIAIARESTPVRVTNSSTSSGWV